MQTPYKPEKLTPCSWLNPVRKSDTFYHLETSQPFLVLWTKADINNIWGDPVWKTPEDWTKIYHQTGGYACLHMNLWAKFLPPKPKTRSLMDELNSFYHESCICPPTSLANAIVYESFLNYYGLTANNSHHELQEGFYPIDIECLKKVTSEKLPNDLAELVRLPKSNTIKAKLARLRAPWFSLAILTENCD